MKRIVSYRKARSEQPLSVAKRDGLGSFDLWLQRFSLIAQVGLFIFTVGTLYFTVIPLYQKALLDEEIAKKQVLLERTQSDLAKAYAQVRHFTVWRFVLDAGMECSGLMIPPDREHDNSHATLDIDPAGCLQEEYGRVSLHALRPEDQQLVHAKVGAIGQALLMDRASASKRYGEAEATVRKNPLPARVPGDTERAVRLLVNIPPSEEADFSFQLAVSQERLNASLEYAQKVRDRISTLNQIRWDEAAGPQ